MSARTVLQRSLNSTERAELRRKKYDKSDNTPEILDISEGRLKYRFIKDPKTKVSKASQFKKSNRRTKEERKQIHQKKKSSIKLNNFTTQLVQNQNTDNKSENKSNSLS